jgi:hypothetical protein
MMRRGTPTRRTKHSIKIVCLGLAFIVLGMAGSPALALDPMGPPASVLRQGDYKLTLDYSFGQRDLDLSEGTWKQRVNGVPLGSGQSAPLTIDDFEEHRAYAGLGYGLADSWEVFLRLGGVKSTFGDSLWGAGEEFEGDIDYIAGGGIKATFYEEGNWQLGGLLQASYAQLDGKLDASTPGWLAPDFVEIWIAEAQIALGATYRWTERLSLYGGPFAHMIIMGEFGDTFTTYDNTLNTFVAADYWWDIDKSLNYGGYFGASVILGENSTLNVEYQLAGDASTIGLGVMWRI